jgi:hypothetical protein
VGMSCSTHPRRRSLIMTMSPAPGQNCPKPVMPSPADLIDTHDRESGLLDQESELARPEFKTSCSKLWRWLKWCWSCWATKARKWNHRSHTRVYGVAGT